MAYKKDTYRFYGSNDIEIKFAGKYGAKGEKRAKKKKPTKEQIKKQNQLNREKRIWRQLRKNFRRGDYWCTLKYPAGTRKSLQEVEKDFRNFRTRMKRVYKKAGQPFKYIYRLEIGEQGGIHIHMVLNRIPDIDITIQNQWKEGRVNYAFIYETGGMKKLANYITKQPTEEIYEQLSLFPEEEQKKLIRYSPSRNLITPKPETKTYKRKTLRREIEYGPTPTKGYYIDKNSIVFGTNPYTGMSYLHYTEYRTDYSEDDGDA